MQSTWCWAWHLNFYPEGFMKDSAFSLAYDPGAGQKAVWLYEPELELWQRGAEERIDMSECLGWSNVFECGKPCLQKA